VGFRQVQGVVAAGKEARPQSPVDLAWLRAHAAEWDRLQESGCEPTPFLARSVIEASAIGGVLPADIRFLAPRDGQGLLALAPILARVRLGWRQRPMAGVWVSPYGPDARPLLDGSRLEAAAEALLDAMEGMERLWLVPQLSLDSRAGAALRAAILRRNWPSATFAAFLRPVLARRDSHAAYREGVRARRLDDLDRRRRRLEAESAVTYEAAVDGERRGLALEAFLTLEAAGWKGRRGTALASHPGSAAYARALFAGEPADVRPRIDRLLVGGETVAASLALVSHQTAYLLKTAYDSRRRGSAPGLLLELEIIRACHESGFAERLDSAAVAGGPLAELYPDREPIGDLLFATDPGINARDLARLARSEESRRRTMRRLKDRYWLLRDRLPTVSGRDPR
jgi:CelD/BcsL family acetyltransferase involved in cellulose biosynthesis